MAVIIDHTNRRMLDVLENRDQATRAVFGPDVSVVIDRFHVVKYLQERLVAARRERPRELSPNEARQLKGSRWQWSKNFETLTAEERQQPPALRGQFPTLARLAEQRETLRSLFEDRRITTSAAGQERLKAWLATARELGLTALNAFCQSLENWLPLLANDFAHRSSNGPTEGFNRGFRTIPWRAFGMPNIRNFRLRILDRFGHPQPQEST